MSAEVVDWNDLDSPPKDMPLAEMDEQNCQEVRNAASKILALVAEAFPIDQLMAGKLSVELSDGRIVEFPYVIPREIIVTKS